MINKHSVLEHVLKAQICERSEVLLFCRIPRNQLSDQARLWAGLQTDAETRFYLFHRRTITMRQTSVHVHNIERRNEEQE